MPLRLTANDKSLSGHEYDDVLGVRYEFPSRYRRVVNQGERFVYYRGRRRSNGTTGPQVYLGVGIIGTVRQSRSNPNYRVCDIEDWQPFAEPLYFKDASGAHYESGGTQGGLYWREGVKRISEDVFQRILRDANGDPVTQPQPGVETAERGSYAGYASSNLLSAVDEYAVAAARLLLRELWPASTILLQPHNNPGYDIVVGPLEDPERFVEVKGTTLHFARFFLSEGERQFAQSHADAYTLLVIHSIDLKARTHEVFRWDGAVSDDQFVLVPQQWACEPKRVIATAASAAGDGYEPTALNVLSAGPVAD